MIILYTTGCPRCHVLETKLKQKNIEYVECNDVEEMEKKDISSVSMKLSIKSVKESSSSLNPLRRANSSPYFSFNLLS